MSKYDLDSDDIVFVPTIELGSPVIFLLRDKTIATRIPFYMRVEYLSTYLDRHIEYVNKLSTGQSIDWGFSLDITTEPYGDGWFMTLDVVTDLGETIPYIAKVRNQETMMDLVSRIEDAEI